MKSARSIFFSWLPLALAIVGLSMLLYAAVQQNYRQSLNDPQIQMAEDGAAAIRSGEQIDQVIPKSVVDISASLSPWLAVYNSAGAPILSSGTLDGEVPQVPQGVLEDARSGASKDTMRANEDRVTWQSPSGVRQAIVVVYFNSPNGSGFVVAGRNMREVEEREGALENMISIGMIVLLLATLAAKAIRVRELVAKR